MKRNQWVLPRPNGMWAVHGEGNSKDTKHLRKQQDAVSLAISIAKNKRSEVIIKGRNGRIRSKDSYGNDPCPPRDREH